MAKIRLPGLGFVKRVATGRNSARRIARPVQNEPKYYTGKTKAALDKARKESVLTRQSQIEIIHLLLALAADKTSPVSQTLSAHGLTLDYLRAALTIGPAKTATTEAPSEAGAGYSQVLELATGAALRLKHPYIGPEHLLLGILELAGESECCSDLELLKARRSEIEQELLRLLQSPQYQPFAYSKIKKK